VNGNHKKEKMSSLQKVIYTGPPKSGQAKVLQKSHVPQGKQGCQSTELAE
jgi:hypothetical protein